MKMSLKMWGRIIILLVISLVAYVCMNMLLMQLFTMIQKNFPVLKGMEGFRHAAAIFSGSAVAYLFFLKPFLHIIGWIQALSRGNYQEPVREGLFTGKCSVFHWYTRFLYKELLVQMQRLTDKLQQAEREREALEKKRREWLSGITHDLKTPLSYVQGYAAMISSGRYKWSEEELKNFSMQIEEKSGHIKQLIDDLNTSFQSEEGKVFLRKTRTEMIEFLRQTVLDAANSPRCMEYDFSYIPKIESCFLEVDTVLLQRALQNILMNGVIHNPPGTGIELVAERQQGGLKIRIADNGKGMEEDTREHLFESYYRGTSTDSPTEGSGLGMAIAKQFIELHGGSIRAESRLGTGTSFFIELPFV